MKVKKYSPSDTYIERDISWMYFNHRILIEASKEETPLLERLNFLGIYSNNLDEFFRVRVAILNRILSYQEKFIKKERAIAAYTIKQINKLNTHFNKVFEDVFADLWKSLENENIYMINENQLNESQKNYITDLYKTQLSSATIPLFLNSAKQLQYETDKNLYLAIKLTQINPHNKRITKDYALIELPVAEFGRFINLPQENNKHHIIFLEDAIRFCLPMIFTGMEYSNYEAYSFCFTKDAEMEIDSDVNYGVLQKIDKGVKSRKKGNPIRAIYDKDMPKDLLKQVFEKLSLNKSDVKVAGGRHHNLKDLMKFPDCGRKDLKFPAQPPLYKPELFGKESVFKVIRNKDQFLHYPYHSFDSYILLLREAAINKKVKSIKTSLYRVANQSKVVKALISAARNGKKVTVVIELMARFDEASNIDWSKKMEDAGINVIFGVEGLKVHSKITHISTTEGDIACICTGNFHEGNARAYTDIALMTAHRPIVHEINTVFKFIEKPYIPVNFKELLVSPNDMRHKLIQLINKEIKNKQNGKEAYILIKVNHITDKALIDKLYEASNAGVIINMVVRGNCSIITGMPGLSENIYINGIIDRYLEHSRIFIFANNGDERYYIGSADLMPRNMDLRIEVLTPVYDKSIQKHLKQIIEFGLHDNTHGYIVDGSGKNLPWTTEDITPFRSQEELYKFYKKEIQINQRNKRKVTQ